jgi:ribosomal-protein-alanine N-acetyltransferase
MSGSVQVFKILAVHSMDIQITSYDIVDAQRLREVCNSDKVVEGTLALPHPYTLEHAKDWIARSRMGINQVHLAVRDMAKPLQHSFIGAVSLKEITSEKRADDSTKVGDSAEVGYYLDPKYNGKQIGTEMCKFICEYGFDVLNMESLTARLFEWNVASRRVLEKSGFQLVQQLPGYYAKNGQLVDGLLMIMRNPNL